TIRPPFVPRRAGAHLRTSLRSDNAGLVVLVPIGGSWSFSSEVRRVWIGWLRNPHNSHSDNRRWISHAGPTPGPRTMALNIRNAETESLAEAVAGITRAVGASDCRVDVR